MVDFEILLNIINSLFLDSLLTNQEKPPKLWYSGMTNIPLEKEK